MQEPELLIDNAHGLLLVVHFWLEREKVVDDDAEVFVLLDYWETVDLLWVDNFLVVSVPEDNDGGFVSIDLETKLLADFVKSGNGEIKSQLAFTVTDNIISKCKSFRGLVELFKEVVNIDGEGSR